MTRDAILTELKAERDRLDAAITALEGGGTKRHPRHRRRLSAEARKRISEAIKRSWGRRKKAASRG